MKLIFVFLALLLMIKATEAMPVWSDTYPSASSSTYFPNENFNFQIAWTGSNESYAISNVLFESNFSGSLANITVSNSSNIYFVNFTDLPANNYAYRWYAVDNESNWNFTDQLAYTVNKNSSVAIKLYLNGTQTSKEYNLNSVANFTASLAIPNKTIYLDSNYTGFVLQSSPYSLIANLTNLTSSGLFSIVAYWNGDENYSAFSQTYYFDNLPPRYLTRSEYPLNPTDYNFNANYVFGSTWYDLNISQVLFESNFSGSFRNYSASTTPAVINNSNGFSILIPSLPAETILYRWIAFDILGHTSNSTRYEYDILKKFPLLIDVTPARTVLIDTETVVICHSATSEVPISNFKLYRNATLIDNDTMQSRKDDKTLSIGVYEYVCNSTETQNFTGQEIKVILNVTLIIPVNQTGSLDLTGPSSIQVYAGGTVKANLLLENNLGYSLSNITLSVAGLDSSWYSFNELPASIPNSFSLPIIFNVSVPADAEQKDYNVILTARAKTPSNEFIIAAKTLNLTVQPQPQPQNFPPVYSTSISNKTDGGYEFSLKWNDDNGLSGYIFSSNISGTWENDSFVYLTGTEGLVNVTKNISLSSGQTIAWKVYATDANNLWTESEEFYLTASEKKPDMIFPIIAVSLFVVGLAALLLFLTHRKPKKVPKKGNEIYVYSKEDLK